MHSYNNKQMVVVVGVMDSGSGCGPVETWNRKVVLLKAKCSVAERKDQVDRLH